MVKLTLWSLHLTDERAVIVKPIPEEIVEKTWREVAQFTPAQIKKEISRLGREQGDLLDFVLESTVDMSRASHELAVYLFFTVFRMFQKVHGKGIPPSPRVRPWRAMKPMRI
jgi:hypothetical protein